jgi:peptidoglycan hydrolase FlgJ
MPALPPSLHTGLAGDARTLDSLRRTAASDPKSAAREAAKQFESLFMQEMLKSMRQATPTTGLMDSQGTKLGQDLLDAQLTSAKDIRQGSLADIIARQLERQMGPTPGPIPSTKPANASLPTVRTPGEVPKVPQTGALGFVQQHQRAASQVAQQSGIPATFMLAQAALETGWGAKEIIGNDGTRSHNLFGIKAGSSWKGPTVDIMTTEYVDGKAQKMVQKFRAYGSFAESFADYARLINDNPRYAQARAAVGNAKAFAQNLQSAGYATDPAYAQKLSAVIDTATRLQRTQA